MTTHATEGPAFRRALGAFGVTVLLAVGACTPPWGGGDRDEAGADGRPRPELGITPAPLPADDAGTAAPATAGTPGASPPGAPGRATSTTIPAPGSPASPTGSTGPGATTATTIADTYRTVTTATDRRGDHGADGPGYADLVQLRIDRGTRTMRFVVDVGGDLPAALATAEVEGLGVDLYRGLGLESAYQVFVDGGSDGWRAFFQVDSDFVQFRGTFRLGGNRLELVVPLTAFTRGEPERASAFADWSRRTDAATRNSEDLLPELGTVDLAR